jgi:nucleoside-triphosphatase
MSCGDGERQMNIFITGNPGCGKSTLIRKLLAEMSGRRVAGMITPEIRENGKRKGFKIIDLASGQEEILASVNRQRGPGVSRYRVNLDAIDVIIGKFLESYENSEYVVIDEIGMMEFYSRKFREIVDMVMASDKIVIATLSKRFAREYQSKGELYSLTRGNFDAIFGNVRNRFKRSLDKA